MVDFKFYLNRQGPRGQQGEQGEQGFSPSITINSNTASEFTLLVTNENDSFVTPNLRADQVTDMGGTYIRYNPETRQMYAGYADTASDTQRGEVLLAADEDIELGTSGVVVTADQLKTALDAAIEKAGGDVEALRTEMQTAISGLTASISTETTQRTLADNALSARIDSEVSTRVTADTALSARIDSIVIPDISNLATKDELAEVEAEIPDVSNLATKSELSTEVTARTNADTLLATSISTVASSIPDVSGFATTTQLSQEASTRSSEDTRLEGLINSITVPTVNDPTITFNYGTTPIGDFTLNQSTTETITIPEVTVNTATSSTPGIVQPDNTSIVINNGVISATAQTPTQATSTTLGIVKPDNDTIVVDENGVISATASGGVQIDDTTTTTNATWSSEKINTSIQTGDEAVLETVMENFIANDGLIAGEGISLTSTTTTTGATQITINNSITPRNICEIFPSLVPVTDSCSHLLDGTLLNYGSYKKFIDRIAEIYEDVEATSSYESNVTKVGSLTDNNGVLSNFSTSNYAVMPAYPQTTISSFEIQFKFTTPNDLSVSRTMLGNYNTNRWTPQFAVDPASGSDPAHCIFLASNTGTSWDASITANVTPNTTYTANIKWNGGTLTGTLTDDNGTVTNFTESDTLTSVSWAQPAKIGIDETSNPFIGGSIDLRQSYVNINGSLFWTGANVISQGCFCTESEWQTSVTNYGVCGKFVYDRFNNTVRLPKITGIIEGTTDVSALGNLVEAGLPNITAGTYTIVGSDSYSGSFYGDPFTNKYNEDKNNSSYWYENALNFDASRSSSIYGNSTTVQPQTIKVLYYIVIATSSKTDIQVDIDEIATDLNSKADIDLSNVPASKGILVESYNNGTSWYRLYSDGWCEQGFRESKASGGVFNFLKTFRDTNYLIQISSAEGGGQPQRTTFDRNDIYTDRLNVYTYQGVTQIVSLYVAGYIR